MSILKNLIFCDFFTYGQFLLKIEKNENFQNGLKFNLSGIISTKTSISPRKSGEVQRSPDHILTNTTKHTLINHNKYLILLVSFSNLI